MLTCDELYVLHLIRLVMGRTDEFSLNKSSCNWDNIAKIIIRNGLLLTVYEAADDPLKARLRGRYIAEVAQSVNQRYEGNLILNKMNELGYQCIALKGWELRQMYPHDNMRQMADIDILFYDYDYGKIKKAMEELGYIGEPESSWMHDNFKKGDITSEAHKRLTDDSNLIQDWERRMWSRAVCDHEHVFTMTPEDFYTYHLIHLSKDYKSGLLGLKRIVDTWVLLHFRVLDMRLVEAELRSINIWDFHNKILKTTYACMGITSIDEDSRVMLLHAFRYGIYGTDNSYKLGRIAYLSKGNNMNIGMIKSAIAAVFLPYSRMRAHFPILKRFPFLLPYFWIKRITRLLHRDNVRWAVSNLNYTSLDNKDFEEMRRFLQIGGFK